MAPTKKQRGVHQNLSVETAASAPLTSQRGFTLIEILVAVLVLSFGVLGVAGLQAASLRASREARAQETGTRMASELAELIRANHLLALDKKGTGGNPYLVEFSTTPPAAPALPCFTGTECVTDLAIAQRDMADWSQRAAKALPGIKVKICYDASPYGAGGLPEWACDNIGKTIYVKIGWARTAIDGRKTTLDNAVAPAVMIPVMPSVS